MVDQGENAWRLGVRFWGVRGSLPAPGADTAAVGGNTPCVEILTPASRDAIIIDAGSGIRALGHDLLCRPAPLPRIHLFLSHFHWDHVQGFPYFAPLYTAGATIDCYAAGDCQDLRRALSNQMAPPYYPFPLDGVASQLRFHTVAPAGIVIGDAAAPVRMIPVPLRHPQGCTGFRVEAEETVVVYASDFERGDPAYDVTLDRACRGAALLVCDAQYTDDEIEAHRGWGHRTLRQATEIARAAAVGRLALFHHDPVRTDADLDRIVHDAREVFRATEVAREGDVIVLPA